MRERIDVLLGKALELCSSAVKRAADFDEEHRLQVRLVNSLSGAYLQAASGLSRAREVAAGATQQYVRQPLTDATAAVVVGLGHAAAAAEAQAARLSGTELAKSAGASLQSVGEQLDRVAAQVSGLKPFEQSAFALATAREQVAAVRSRWADLPPEEVPQEAAAEALAAARGALAAVQAAALARTESLRQGTEKAVAEAQSALATVLAEASGRVQNLRIATESAAERAVRAGAGAVKVVTTGCLGAAGRADARVGLASLVLSVDERVGAMVPLPLGAARRAVEMLPVSAADGEDESGTAGAKGGAGRDKGPAAGGSGPAAVPRAMSSQVLEGVTIAQEGCSRAVGACDTASRGVCVSLPVRAAVAVDSTVMCGMGQGIWKGAVAGADAATDLVRWSAGVFFGERARALHALEGGSGPAGEEATGPKDEGSVGGSGGGAAAAAGWLPVPSQAAGAAEEEAEADGGEVEEVEGDPMDGGDVVQEEAGKEEEEGGEGVGQEGKKAALGEEGAGSGSKVEE